MLVGVGPRLLALGLARGRPALMAMALDLMVPPLAASVPLLGGLALADAAWWLWAGDPAPFIVACRRPAARRAAVLVAWWREGRRLIGAARAVRPRRSTSPPSLPMYLRLLGKRQVEWVRT